MTSIHATLNIIGYIIDIFPEPIQSRVTIRIRISRHYEKV